MHDRTACRVTRCSYTFLSSAGCCFRFERSSQAFAYITRVAGIRSFAEAVRSLPKCLGLGNATALRRITGPRRGEDRKNSHSLGLLRTKPRTNYSSSSHAISEHIVKRLHIYIDNENVHCIAVLIFKRQDIPVGVKSENHLFTCFKGKLSLKSWLHNFNSSFLKTVNKFNMLYFIIDNSSMKIYRLKKYH